MLIYLKVLFITYFFFKMFIYQLRLSVV